MPGSPLHLRRLDSRVRAPAALAAGIALGLLPHAAWAVDPEDRGPLAINTWDAGSVALGDARIRTRVYYPTEVASYPLVALLHGANGDGTYHPEMASALASRGMVVLVPDMPCTVVSCDHDRNANTTLALLEWAIDRSGESGAPIAGRVDAERRGLIGHSWGGLTVHLAAARSDTFDSLVLLDPNDDGTEGRDATPSIRAPTLQLIAETEGICNSQWREGLVREALDVPTLQATLTGVGHCDAGERDVLCSIACGSGSTPGTATFRRYAVAWTACNLLDDADMATWVGGSGLQADTDSGVLSAVAGVRLDELPCRRDEPSDPEPDAGGADAGLPDAGADDAVDAVLADTAEDGVSEADADAPEAVDDPADDAPTTEVGVDAQADDVPPSETGADTSRVLPDPSSPSGCAAVAPPASLAPLFPLALLLLRRRRRAGPERTPATETRA